MATSTATPTSRGGMRIHVQRFGTFLSNMVLPNIAAFIAWGLITALFIETGWVTLIGGWVGYDGGYGIIEHLGAWGKGADGTRHRRADDHLPAATPDRLHRRPDDVRRQHPRRCRRGDRDDRRHHRCQRADVPRRDGHGAARRLVDEEDRRAVGGQDPAGLRDAGQQLLGRHLGRLPRGRSASRSPGRSSTSSASWPRTSWTRSSRTTCCRSRRSSSSRRRSCSSTTRSTTAS